MMSAERSRQREESRLTGVGLWRPAVRDHVHQEAEFELDEVTYW